MDALLLQSESPEDKAMRRLTEDPTYAAIPHMCGGKLSGLPISSGSFLQVDQSKPTWAFDGDLGTQWHAPCDPEYGCLPQGVWIGLFFSTRYVINCMRMKQSGKINHQATSVLLQRWDGDHWEDYRGFAGFGGDTWNLRPAKPHNMWRITNVAPVYGNWRVRELEFYTDPGCKAEEKVTLPFTPLGSHSLHDAAPPILATDGEEYSYWSPDCQVCDTPAIGWVGVQYDSQETPSVQCMRILQSSYGHQSAGQIQMEHWDGTNWVYDMDFFDGLGAGAWERRPAQAFSLWRLRAEDLWQHSWGDEEVFNDDRGLWRVQEMQFYADIACRHEISQSKGSTAIASGHFIGLSGLKSVERFGEFAQDGDIDSYWQQNGPEAWVGLDMNMAVDIRCIRLMQSPQREYQANTIWLEAWDGRSWDLAPYSTAFKLPWTQSGGGSPLLFPAPRHSRWRITNDRRTYSGWIVKELRFYENEMCHESSALNFPLISSGYRSGVDMRGDVVELMHHASKASDGNVDTYWHSDCDFCDYDQAWIGIDLGADVFGKQVRCIKMVQSGYSGSMVSAVGMWYWDSQGTWTHQVTHGGLGAGTWEQRPVQTNAMWRIVQKKRRDWVCEGSVDRIGDRPWGVSELMFFSDDDCNDMIQSGDPISSGYFPHYDDFDTFHPSKAFDYQSDTNWAAGCDVPPGNKLQIDAECGEFEWIGSYFQSPTVVRCFKVQQTHSEDDFCCDPAKEVQLERWNGTQWVLSLSEHKGINDDVGTLHIAQTYTHLGECASFYETSEDFNVEWRSRRDSDQCIVPLSSSMNLLAKPKCFDHPACWALGHDGDCCPIGADYKTRCCCKLLDGQAIYLDETSGLPAAQDNLRVEEFIISCGTLFPLWGAIFAGGLWAFVSFAPEKTPIRLKIRKYLNSEPRSPLKDLIFWTVGGVKGHGGTKERNITSIVVKGLIVVWFGFFIIGSAIWVIIGLVFAELILFFVAVVLYPVRMAKSPYPLDREGNRRRQRDLYMLDQEIYGMQPPGIGFLAIKMGKTFKIGFAYFFKFFADIVVIRTTFIGFGFKLEPITEAHLDVVVPSMTGEAEVERTILTLIEEVVSNGKSFFAEAMSGVFGIPACEGPTIVLATTTIITIVGVLVRWLNYDSFSLLFVARGVLRETRLPIQKQVLGFFISLSQSAIFIVIQLTMLQFQKSLALANPWNSQIWICPFDDVVSIILGRGVFYFIVVGGLAIFWLCINGHFFGQSYITDDIGKVLGMNFDDLDPDGTGGWWKRKRFDCCNFTRAQTFQKLTSHTSTHCQQHFIKY